MNFIDRVIEKLYLSFESSHVNLEAKSTIRNNNEQMVLGTYSGEGTIFKDLFIDSDGSDFSLSLNQNGKENDKIILDIKDEANITAWTLTNGKGETVGSGQNPEISISDFAKL